MVELRSSHDKFDPALPTRDVSIKRGIDAKEFYELIEEIGRGKFGTVYNCREKSTGLKLAAKYIPIPKREDRRNVEREVEIMNSLQHPKIIQLYDAYEFSKNMWVILELIEGGELFERVIDENYVLTEKACIIIIRQVCEAIEFVHRNSILHLDLKPENILCTTKEGNRIKLIDFGLARKYDPDKKLQVLFGTPEFVAPEVVNFDRISFGTDMWSIGVICYVLLSGLSPFMGETDIETMTNVTIAKYDFDDEAFNDVSPAAIDFIAKLLVKDINERMTALECLEHKWLQRKYSGRPPLLPKPSLVPPLKLLTISPEPSPSPSPISLSPQPVNRDLKSQSPLINKQFKIIEPKLKENSKPEINLNKTKENLKEFVQRWGEHPNSPYVFDVENNLISPPIQLELKENSNLSSRGCSPSPCESLTSTNDIENNKVDSNDSNISILEDSNEINKINNNNNNNITINNNKTNDILNSFKEEDEEAEQNNSYRNSNKNIREYLQSFDRRNSDSKVFVQNDILNSNYDRINLADEIKKLSDRLLILSQIHVDLGQDETITSTATPTPTTTVNATEKINESGIKVKPKKKIPKTKTGDEKMVSLKPEVKKKPEKIKSKLNECFNHSVKINNVPPSPTSPSLSETKNISNVNNNTIPTSQSDRQTMFKTHKISHRSSSSSSLSSSFDKIEENHLAGIGGGTSTITRRFSTQNTNGGLSQINNKNNNETYNFGKRSRFQQSKESLFSQTFNGNDTNIVKTPIWAASLPSANSTALTTGASSVRRAKFRITQASRDVPLDAPNQHSTIFIEESAKATKDCLLKLLEKYHNTSNSQHSDFNKSFKSESSSSICDSNMKNIGRHQSISTEWGISDNLENHTMNSINAFFHRHASTNRTGSNTVKQIKTQLEARTNN